MIEFLKLITRTKVATDRRSFPELDSTSRGLPELKECDSLSRKELNNCVELCPTRTINLENGTLSIDLGNCIGCGVCVDEYPAIFGVCRSTRVARTSRSDLIVSGGLDINRSNNQSDSTFKKSVSIRVVSTGCSACDLEVGAVFNPVFDAERFGIKIVASPRMADILLVTGPVGNGMKSALVKTFEAMPEPKLVVAAGTCAISGGLHRDGYAEANGVDSVIPVDVYIPGCPPHPWSIIHGIRLAMSQETE